MRTVLAAAQALGGVKAGRTWAERHNGILDAVPLELVAESWAGLVRAARVLEATWLGCTAYDPGSSPFRIGCLVPSLTGGGAEHHAALKRSIAG